MLPRFANVRVFALAGSLSLLTGCMVGPRYSTPSAPMSAAYKEPPPDGWKEAQPNDGKIRGKWWEMYNDPQLNTLEEQVSISNQNLLAAEAQFQAARATVRIARSNLFPVVSVGPSFSNSRTGSTNSALSGGARNQYSIPFDFSWEADLWGSIRRGVTAAAENAQVTAAQLENARLTYQSELAQDYFQLHGTDGEHDLLDRTVKSYQQFLELTQNRQKSGVASGGDVAQAQTQLDSARAQLIDLDVARAQFEHAIAILTGKTPSELTIPFAVLKTPPPVVPVGFPSTLLERRPDIAAAERQMASANEQIGIAQAAFYPTLTLGASAGLASTGFAQLFSWPARLWSIGPTASQTLFDAGKRRGQLAQVTALYDVTVANYRQTVLTGFQQVEDNLAALRILEKEAAAQDQAVKAAEESLQIATFQYQAGTVNYLQVITTQATALQNERTAIDLLTRRMTASVMLIEALGGGWESSSLPSVTELKLSAK